ncbi:DNA-3-methyladenine glycosylase family protein [Streptosporangium amethystogenes]|uniref:DNA-3-methyladenine glycosylase family protein n=1 Tax=Streptosporangium amethystogenes TaxID=2002 RepID=UPI0037A1F20F
MLGERGDRVYRRTLRLPSGTGVAEVAERMGDSWLECRLHLSDLRDLTNATQRMRQLFDLDADPFAIADLLGGDPMLGAGIARRLGLRAPGAADPHELAIRAVLGQQDTLAAGRERGNALVAAYGEALPAPCGGLTHLFPAAEVLAQASLTEIAMPAARRETLRGLADALADGRAVLDPGADRDEAERALLAVPGIEPWTAGYVRMRALSDPDVLLAGDAALQNALQEQAEAPDSQAWRPWRSYAMHHVWANPVRA